MEKDLRTQIDELSAELVKKTMAKFDQNKNFTFAEVTKIVANSIFFFRVSLAKLMKTLPQVMKNGKM